MVTKSLWQRGRLGEVGVTRVIPRRDGLVLRLPLHRLQGDTIYSEEGRRQLCTVTGALWTPQGRTFDGDDVISAGSGASLAVQAFSLFAWIKATDANLPTAQYIAGRGAQGWNAVSYTLTLANGKIKLTLGNQVDGRSELVADTTLSDATWYLIGFTWDGTTGANKVLGYVNGVQDYIGTSTIAPLVHNQAFRIGQDSLGASPFYGTVGEVWLFNRVLSVSEILNLRLATKWRY